MKRKTKSFPKVQSYKIPQWFEDVFNKHYEYVHGRCNPHSDYEHLAYRAYLLGREDVQKEYFKK